MRVVGYALGSRDEGSACGLGGSPSEELHARISSLEHLGRMSEIQVPAHETAVSAEDRAQGAVVATNHLGSISMRRLLEVDRQLTPLLAEIVQVASEVDMPLVCTLEDEPTIAAQNYPGIYRIDISTAGAMSSISEWIETFRAEWEHEHFKKKFTPNLKKKRIARHLALPDWMPLYLGKSKNVSSRVLEHINLPLEKTTFALKLKSRPAMAKYRLRLHALPVPVENYDLVVPVLESALRNRFNPLIGKQ